VATYSASDLWSPDRWMDAKWGSGGRRISGQLTFGSLPSGELVGVGSPAVCPWDGCQVAKSSTSDLRQPDRGMAAKWQSPGRRIFGSLTVGWLPSGRVVGVGFSTDRPWDGCQVATSWASDLWQPDRGMAAKSPSSGRWISVNLTVGWLPSGNVIDVGSLATRLLDGCQVANWWASDICPAQGHVSRIGRLGGHSVR